MRFFLPILFVLIALLCLRWGSAPSWVSMEARPVVEGGDAPVLEALELASAIERSVPIAPANDLPEIPAGSGIVQGQIVDGEGQPARPLELAIHALGLDPREALRGRAKGLWARTRTDEEGRFFFSDLQPGTYLIEAREQGTWRVPVRLTPLPVPIDGPDLRLVFDAPCLSITLLDEWGAHIESAPVGGLTSHGVFEETYDGSSVPRIRVVELGFTARAEPSIRAVAWESRRTPPVEPTTTTPGQRPVLHLFNEWRSGAILFPVDAGKRYGVSVMGAGFDGRFRVVEVTDGQGCQPLTFTAREVPLGTLEVLARTGDGAGDGNEKLSITVEDPETGRRLLPAGTTFQLPAGSYRVVAQETFSSWYRRTLAATTRRCEVRAGETTRIELEMEPGGWLDVELSGSPEAADKAQGIFAPTPNFLDSPIPSVFLGPLSAWLTLESEGREFAVRQEPRSVQIYPDHLWSVSRPGSRSGTHTRRSAVLPAGEYELVARLPGGRAQRLPVVIRPGEGSPVRVAF